MHLPNTFSIVHFFSLMQNKQFNALWYMLQLAVCAAGDVYAAGAVYAAGTVYAARAVYAAGAVYVTGGVYAAGAVYVAGAVYAAVLYVLQGLHSLVKLFILH